MSKIICPVFQHAHAEHSRNSAIIWGRRRLSWQQLHQCVTSTTKKLKEFSIKPEQRIALHVSNSVEAVIFLLACCRLGVVACLLNTRLPRDVLNEMMQSASIGVLVVDGDDHGLKNKRILSLGDCVCFDVMETLYGAGESPEINLDQLTTVVWTSGSSGKPKAVQHTYGNHYYSALGLNESVGLGTQDSWILSLPLYHVAGVGIIFRCVAAGASILVDELSETSLGKVTHVSMVPTQLQRLANESLGHLKCILLGGGVIPDTLKEQSLKNDWPVYTTYGLTEMSSSVAVSKLIHIDQGADVLSYRRVEIRDGEIIVGGDVLFKGYLGDAPVGEWFATGDIGALDGSELRVVGRKDNMFISGGENIYPEEIERALLNVEGINQAMVVVSEDKEFGQRPVAFVDTALSVKNIREKLEGKLASYKTPKVFVTWPKDIPSVGIKLVRKDFQEYFNKEKATLL